MPWLLLLLAFGALVLAFITQSTLVLGLSLLASLGLFLAGIMGVLARRVEGRSRNEAMMIDPVELQRLREQAEARRNMAATETDRPST